jgi:photosystem II stability/assembly factor-like uncharacterized protein
MAQSIKLLAPNVGWLVPARNRVLWTTDGGLEWKNITPPAPRDAAISAIFFLDTARGWVLFMRGAVDAPGNLHFDLASTENAGATWSMEPLKIPDQLSRLLFNGGASLAFADPRHGLLALATGLTPISEGYGAVLATSDGGKTWKDTHTSLAGSIVMVTPEFGWLVGGGDLEALHVTRDGARTWQQVELDSPVKTEQMQKADRNLKQFWDSFQRAIPPAAAQLAAKRPEHETYAAYDLPTFSDPRHGYICVTYPGVTVLFATDDGGVTWRPDRVLTGLQEQDQGDTMASAVVNSAWITARVPKNGVPQLRALGAGAHAVASTAPGPEDFRVSGISFATPRQGWVLTVYNKLLSTNDGGASWTDITPGKKPPAVTP